MAKLPTLQFLAGLSKNTLKVELLLDPGLPFEQVEERFQSEAVPPAWLVPAMN